MPKGVVTKLTNLEVLPSSPQYLQPKLSTLHFAEPQSLFLRDGEVVIFHGSCCDKISLLGYFFLPLLHWFYLRGYSLSIHLLLGVPMPHTGVCIFLLRLYGLDLLRELS